MSVMRLDRFLTEACPKLTRKSAKELIHAGRVSVNETVTKKEDLKVSDTDSVTIDGTPVSVLGTVYFVYHKPEGELSATEDKRQKTVMDRFPEQVRANCFPVGRLDIDTTGLLLITNDGDFNHRLMSPKKHVKKTYEAVVCGRVTAEGKMRLETGIQFAEFTSGPAEFFERSYDAESDTSVCELIISEGKFHQVKRMFAAVGNDVLKLKRTAIGAFRLPEELEPGDYREYTKEELEQAVFAGSDPA